MTATTLGLNGPVMFLGAYVKNVTSNLGMSINPSTVTVMLVEDPPNGINFTQPAVGSFQLLEVGAAFSFGGVITKIEKDIRLISGRAIRVTIADPREIMRCIPVILCPGFQDVAYAVAQTECSVLDLFGAYAIGGGALNVSGWTEAGIQYSRLVSALSGDNIRFGTTLVPIDQQVAKAFGVQYRFDLSELDELVDPDYRINTNLAPISNIIEDLSSKFSFDWYIESELATDGIVDVTIKVIDRAEDNIDISLPEFLSSHDGRVVSCTSGVELRNDVAFTVLCGASVEQLQRLSIRGMANEPMDLTTESGSNAYVMTEEEMRVVIAGRHQWELWLAMQAGAPSEDFNSSGNIDYNGGFSRRGFSRYGGYLNDYDIDPLFYVRNSSEIQNLINGSPNIPKNPLRNNLALLSAKYTNAGKVFEKLRAHSEKSYGKRWVHEDVSDDIIDSAWTRDTIAGLVSSSVSVGSTDPNEYFRQSDGRTRAYVEFTNEDAGGAFSLGLSNLTTLFGDQNVFRNVTAFGNTFSTILPGLPGQIGGVLNLELRNNFSPGNCIVTGMEKCDYVYNSSATLTPSSKTSLYVAGTVEKDGVICIGGPVLEQTLSIDALFQLILNSGAAGAGVSGVIGGGGMNGQAINAQILNQMVQQGISPNDAVDILYSPDNNSVSKSRAIPPAGAEAAQAASASGVGAADADGNIMGESIRVKARLKRVYGNYLFNMGVRAYQPKYAYIPVKSRYRRYGPVYATEREGAQGKLEIIQDDGFAPWEFGSAALMIDAMQRKVDNASSNQKEVFSANITIEGFPAFNIGDSLEKNANINSIVINFGDNGVSTSYSLQTFVRKFGEFSKEDWARIALFANSGALKILPNQQALFHNRSLFRVSKQLKGGTQYPGMSVGGAGSLE
jgi:hypothetical protein